METPMKRKYRKKITMISVVLLFVAEV